MDTLRTITDILDPTGQLHHATNRPAATVCAALEELEQRMYLFGVTYRGVTHDKIPTEYAAHRLNAAIFGVLEKWLDEGHKRENEEVITNLAKAITGSNR